MAATPTAGSLTQQQLLQSGALGSQGDALALAGIQGQQALVGPEVAQQVAYGNALQGYQTQQYGVQQQQTGLQSLENTQQSQQNVAQQDVEQANYGLQQGAIGIQGQQLGVQQQQANVAYNAAVTGQQNQGAASGTTYTHGQQNALGTLGANYQLGNQALGLQNALLGNTSQQAQNTQAGEQSGFQFSQEQLQNQQQNINLIAQANGISQDQALTMLNFQNQQAGIQGEQQNQQLATQAGQTISSDATNIGALLGAQSFAAGSTGTKK